MTIKICIEVRGGNVQAVYTNIPGTTEVVVYDHDNIQAGDPSPEEEWARACVEDTPPESFWCAY